MSEPDLFGFTLLRSIKKELKLLEILKDVYIQRFKTNFGKFLMSCENLVKMNVYSAMFERCFSILRNSLAELSIMNESCFNKSSGNFSFRLNFLKTAQSQEISYIYISPVQYLRTNV